MNTIKDLVDRIKRVGIQCPVEIFGEVRHTPEEVDEALRHVHLWTYRKDFPVPLPSSNLHSDGGWGCLIRTGQMLLARGLELHLTRGSVDPQWFCDTPDAPFSIHQFVRAVAQPRQRFSPDYWSATKCCTAIQKVVHAANLGLRVCIAEAGGAYKDEVQFTLRDSPVLLLFPTRAARTERLTQLAFHQVEHLLRSPQCVGVAGGHPKRSYFFVGVSHTQTQEPRLLYLDPHIMTQTAFTGTETRGTGHETAATVQTIAWNRTDASVLVGVYLKDMQALQTLELHGRALRTGPDAPFFLSFSETRCAETVDDGCDFPSDEEDECTGTATGTASATVTGSLSPTTLASGSLGAAPPDAPPPAPPDDDDDETF